VLEDRYHADMTQDEAIDLAIRALKAAMKRDAGSGEGIHIVVITRDQYYEIGEEALKKYLIKTPA